MKLTRSSVLKNGGLFFAVLATAIFSTDTILGFVHMVNAPAAPPEPGPTIELDPPRDGGGDQSGAPLPNIPVPAVADNEDMDGRSDASPPPYRSVAFVQESGSGVVLDYDHVDVLKWNDAKTVLVVEDVSYHVVVEGPRADRLARQLRRREIGLVKPAPLDAEGKRVDPGDETRAFITRVRIEPPVAYHFGDPTLPNRDGASHKGEKPGEYVSDDQ
jgi:hypothetical protein